MLSVAPALANMAGAAEAGSAALALAESGFAFSPDEQPTAPKKTVTSAMGVTRDNEGTGLCMEFLGSGSREGYPKPLPHPTRLARSKIPRRHSWRSGMILDRGLSMALLLATSLLPAATSAQNAYDTTAFAALRWREVGPYRGGRSVA